MAQATATRREFLAAAGAGAAATTLASSSDTAAQGASPMKIVDFHNHYMGASWTLTNLASLPPAARPAWEKINAQSPEPGRAARVGREPPASPRA